VPPDTPPFCGSQPAVPVRYCPFYFPVFADIQILQQFWTFFNSVSVFFHKIFSFIDDYLFVLLILCFLLLFFVDADIHLTDLLIL